jgi:hypothetical protein
MGDSGEIDIIAIMYPKPEALDEVPSIIQLQLM